MAGKVWHASDDLHAEAKAFCADTTKIPPKVWVSRLVRWALDNGVVDPNDGDSSTVKHLRAKVADLRQDLKDERDRPRVLLEPVRKKPRMTPAPPTGEKPWEDPPFWKRDGQIQEAQETDEPRIGPLPELGEGTPGDPS